jgi:hypothetical protein
MRNLFLPAICATIIFMACSKQDATTEPLLPLQETKTAFISFKQDTIALKLSITTARKENVGSLFTTAIEGKLPDSIVRKNNLIIRVTGDSARPYTNLEILASYTDSTGVTYSNSITDTANKVTITKLEKKKQGAVEGNFTIKVSNSTKTKTLILKEGKFLTNFLD